MEKNNSVLKFVVIILSIIIVLLAGYVIYDKSLSNEEITNVDDNNTEINSDEDIRDNEDNTVSYTISDVSEKVYGKDGVGYHFVLWNDETFEYSNDVTNEYGMGRYSVLGDKIYLDFVYTLVDGSNKYELSNLEKEIVILGSDEKLELKDGGLLISTLDQPARSGDGFTTALENVITVYNNR